MTRLRDYQREGVKAILEAWQGARGVMYCLPVGGGKTHVACGVMRRVKGEILFLAHRRELLDQMQEMIADHRVAVGRVTLSSPLKALRHQDLGRFDYVIIDEAHRASGKTYRDILAEMPDAKLLGLSASPSRAGGLRPEFDVLIEGPSVAELVEAGHIVAPTCWSVPKEDEPDLDGVKVTAGDYQVGKLGKAVNKPHLVGNVVREWKKHAKGLSTLVFATSVEHAKSITRAFRRAKVDARIVHGKTKPAERDALLEGFERGGFPVLVNVLLFTEGVDVQRIDCLVLVRPTRSVVLYTQAIGRAMRPSPTGRTPIVLDHSGSVRAHGLPTLAREWSLDASPRAVARGSEMAKRCEECGVMTHLSAMVCDSCGASFRRVDEDADLEEVEPGIDWDAQPLGEVTDTELAKRLGVSVSTVCKQRRDRGIHRAISSNNRGIDWDTQPLGEIEDRWIAERLGVDRTAVSAQRLRRNIAAYDSQQRVIDWDAQPLGKVSDTKLSRRLGCAERAVRRERQRRGIAPSVHPLRAHVCHIDWDAQPLGRISDKSLASNLGVSPGVVTRQRLKRDIKRATSVSFSGVNWDLQPLGEVSDVELGEKLGVTSKAVAWQRRKRGVPPEVKDE